MMPAPITDEGLHWRRLLGVPWWRRAGWEMRQWGRGLWVGVLLVFLLAYQEFELAATFNLKAWSVALFDAQAGGMELFATLQMAVLPVAVQLPLLLVVFLAVRPQAPSDQRRTSGRNAVILAPLAFGLRFGFGAALAILGGAAMALWRRGGEALDVAPWREVANAGGLALASAVLAWVGSALVVARRRWWWWLAVPGLLGPLVCSLLLAAALRWAPLLAVRDSVLAPVLGLTLVLLPFACLLRAGMEGTRDRAALHAASAAPGRWARWPLITWPTLASLLMLFCFAYGDFTVNSILAPPQFTAVSVRLLNLLHYGRSPVLAIMFMIAFALPVAAALLTALAARLYARWRVR
jgi:ABC-type Fe3+ transport system permease subunit